MPKLKTRRSAAKRFKRTGTGKFVRRKAFRNHLLDKKKTKRKVRLGQKAVVVDADAPNVELMMPYS
ncbi:MAG: 50S ribosomal protein L35 [Leptolyngbyaceae cyanobacterium]